MQGIAGLRALIISSIAVAQAGCMSSAASVDDSASGADHDTTATSGDAAGGDTVSTTVVSGAATRTAEPELADGDWNKTWRRLSLPAVSTSGASVVATPTGWIAVSSRDTVGKAYPPPNDSYLYRSVDGTHWRAIPTRTGGGPLRGAHVAYGNGHYIITGSRNQLNVVLDSQDGETWHEQVLDDPYPFSQGPVQYLQERFVFLSASFWASVDGQQWNRHDNPDRSALHNVAYGNGRYLGVGATGTLLSLDGTQWRSAPIDCALPEACLRDPENGILIEEGAGAVFFAEDRFYALPYTVEGTYSSPDGESWQFTPGSGPDGYLSGHFVRMFGAPTVWLAQDGPSRSIEVIRRSSMLPAGVTPADAERWSSSAESDATDNPYPWDEEVPAEKDFSWSDGLDCTTARCLVVTSGTDSQLLLVP